MGRDRDRDRERERERERERIPSRLMTSTEPNTGLNLTTLSGNQKLEAYQLRCPGARETDNFRAICRVYFLLVLSDY